MFYMYPFHDSTSVNLGAVGGLGQDGSIPLI